MFSTVIHREVPRQRAHGWRDSALILALFPALPCFAFAQIVVRGAYVRTLRGGLGIELLFGYHGDAAIVAHLDEFEAFGAAFIHPMPALEFFAHALDGA